MKKLLSSFILAAAALTAQATDYVTTLDINAGSGSKKYPKSTVQVQPNGDGTCTVTIKNVKYEYYMQEQPVGNIVIENVPMTNAGVYTILRSVQDIEIVEGDDTNISWQGPGYTALNGGKLQAYFNGEIRGGKFYGNLIIDTFKAIRRSLKLTLGDEDYTIGQIPNSGFEKFHTATAGSATSQEPNAWHSFMTATGTLASMVKSAVHTKESNETRPGTTGKKSVLITTGKAIFGQIPNGTITTGQMNAGAAQAANTDNHAFLDFSNEALLASQKGLERLMNGINDLQRIQPADKCDEQTKQVVGQLRQKCYDAMNDDLSTPLVISYLFEACSVVNKLLDHKATICADCLKELEETMRLFACDILGLRQEKGNSSDAREEAYGKVVNMVLELRAKAKAEKDWATSDQIRDALAEAGFEVKDTKDGCVWKLNR